MGFENGRLVRVALRASSADKGQETVTVLHYDLDDGGIEPDNDPQSLAVRFRDTVITPFRALFTSSWSIDPVVVTEEIDPQNPGAPREQWSSGTLLAGTAAPPADNLPTAVTVLAYLDTGLVGRSFRGRTFIPGVFGETSQTDGNWTAAFIAAGPTNFMNAIPLQPDISPPGSGATAKWCVYSRTRRARDQDPYAPAITGFRLSSQVRWLRSRQPGR